MKVATINIGLLCYAVEMIFIGFKGIDSVLLTCKKKVERRGDVGCVSWAILADVYLLKGRYELAEMAALNAIHFGFSTRHIHVTLAEAHYKKGNGDEAYKSCMEAMHFLDNGGVGFCEAFHDFYSEAFLGLQLHESLMWARDFMAWQESQRADL